MRVTMSTAPPGAYGTRTLIGLLGYLSCARAAGAPNARQPATRTKPNRFTAFPYVSAASSGRLSRRSRRGLWARRLLGHLDLHLVGDLLPVGDLILQPLP